MYLEEDIIARNIIDPMIDPIDIIENDHSPRRSISIPTGQNFPTLCTIYSGVFESNFFESLD